MRPRREGNGWEAPPATLRFVATPEATPPPQYFSNPPTRMCVCIERGRKYFESRALWSCKSLLRTRRSLLVRRGPGRERGWGAFVPREDDVVPWRDERGARSPGRCFFRFFILFVEYILP